jgi:hypothetical protein
VYGEATTIPNSLPIGTLSKLMTEAMCAGVREVRGWRACPQFSHVPGKCAPRLELGDARGSCGKLSTPN